MEALDKRKISCTYQEMNYDSSIGQPVAWPLHRLSYPCPNTQEIQVDAKKLDLKAHDQNSSPSLIRAIIQYWECNMKGRYDIYYKLIHQQNCTLFYVIKNNTLKQLYCLKVLIILRHVSVSS
jgi:hypothetical protein